MCSGAYFRSEQASKLDRLMAPTHSSPQDPIKPVVAVTGASRGIGHAIVQKFYRQGWDVITLARTPFSEVCPWAEGMVQHIMVDLSDEASIRKACAALKEQLAGRGLSALVNNAGISPKQEDGRRMGAIHTPIETFLQVQHVNLVAPLILCQELIDPLQEARGSVVNVSSIASDKVHPFAGAAYAISKAGLSALTRELAFEYRETGVRVNAISPGEIKTAILSPGTERIVEAQVPMRRMGDPMEVADVVYFLASDQASYINGSEIPINGGQDV